jgi:L-ascorbate metabolism protein UlaG (beta-lactamase superfamily)
MKIELIRHATTILHMDGKRILIDPVLGDKGTMSAIEGVPNKSSNPLVDLPVPIIAITDCDAILVTHTHRDHFDEKAMEVLPKNIPLFCQPEDEEKIRSSGFTNASAVHDKLIWGNVTFNRTGGRHGYGVIAVKMAPVSGFVITAPGEPSVYIMGDTVWCACTRKAMDVFKPDIAVCNCGEAKFPKGRPITMNARDILQVCNASPDIKVVAVHMEAWNHCRLSRESLRDFTIRYSIDNQVLIPINGETLDF